MGGPDSCAARFVPVGLAELRSKLPALAAGLVAAANLRSYHHVPHPGLLADGEMTPRQVAQLTGVSTGTIHYWINVGYLTARRGQGGGVLASRDNIG